MHLPRRDPPPTMPAGPSSEHLTVGKPPHVDDPQVLAAAGAAGQPEPGAKLGVHEIRAGSTILESGFRRAERRMASSEERTSPPSETPDTNRHPNTRARCRELLDNIKLCYILLVMIDLNQLKINAYQSDEVVRPKVEVSTDALTGPKVGYLSTSVDGDPVVPPWGLVAVCVVEGARLSHLEADRLTQKIERLFRDRLPKRCRGISVDCDDNRMWEICVSGVRDPAVVEWFQGETGFSLGGFIATEIKQLRKPTTNDAV
jgi:hypothetical protein